MIAPSEQIFTFIAEWFDPQPQLLKKFLIKYYPETHEVEMKDLKTNRKFLKRTKIPSMITATDWVIGGNITLFARNLKLIDYGDDYTRKLLDDGDESTVVVLPPKLYNEMGKIIQYIEEAGFSLVDVRSLSLKDIEIYYFFVLELLGVHPTDLDTIQVDDSDGFILPMSFRGSNSIRAVGDILSSFTKKPGFRERIVSASSVEEAERWSEVFFGRRFLATATYDSCTCCVIQPHAVKARTVGAILDTILSQGYEISAIQLFRLDRPAAAEFYEVYKGVVHEFNAMVDELSSGPAVALEIRAEDAVATFRKSAGPWDVDMAKELLPATIRARFGKNKVQKAIHCTDLEKDGVSEVAYFFDILANSLP